MSLIALEQSLAAEAAKEAAAEPDEPETPEAEPEDKPEAEPAKEPEAEPDADTDPAIDAEPAAAKPSELTDETEIDVGEGEKLKFGELKAQRLMQADYTKKTQALAEERKQLAAKDAERDADMEEVRDWVRGLNDPTELGLQIAGYFPDALEAFLRQTVSAVAKGVGFDDAAVAALNDGLERAAFKLAKEGGKKVGEQEQAKQGKRTERLQKAKDEADRVETVAAMRRNFQEWQLASLKGNGLHDAKDDKQTEEHARLVHGLILQEIQAGKTITKESYDAAAKKIAALRGPVAKKPVAPSPRAGSGPAKTNGKKPPPAKTQSEGFFAGLRAKHGAS